jgi:hypothetical protein
MNEFIPYLLILILWNPDKPEEQVIDRLPKAFIDQAACEKMGADVVQLAIQAGAANKITYGASYKCVLSASTMETEAAFLRTDEKDEEENERRYQQEKAEYERNLIEEAEQKRKKALENEAWEREYARQKALDKAAEEKSSKKAKPKP